MDLDLVGTQYSIDFKLTVDESKLLKNMNLKAKINNEDYEIGTTKLFELKNGERFNSTNGKKKIELILTWENTDYNQIIDNSNNELSIPIEWNAQQHIN